jgi:hypothetical protein
MALLVQGGVHAVLRGHQKQIVAFTPHRPHGSPAQGDPRQTALTLVGTAGGGDQRVEWRKPLDCPDWMDAAQFAQLPDSLQARA